MCSDGVSGVMTPEELEAAVGSPDLDDCVADIVATTRANGAHDNFSFIIVEIDRPAIARCRRRELTTRIPSGGEPATGPNPAGWR